MRLKVGEVRKLVRETVIDASERFKQKRADDLTIKVAGIAADIGGALAQQDELEKQATEKLEAVLDAPNKTFSVNRMMLRYPTVFNHDDGYPDVSTALQLCYKGADEWPDFVRFVQENAPKCEEAVDAMFAMLGDFEQWADAQGRWPAPWKRYTRWNETRTAVHRAKRTVESILD